MWFKKLTGFNETNADEIREKILIHGEEMHFLPTGRRAKHGSLEIPSLHELRRRVAQYTARNEPSTIEEVIGDVTKLHCEPANSTAIFQVASQFNLLEMISPEITPDDGVDIYDCDQTQGPACAIACGAGTIYRNYFADVNGHRGQSKEHQINCLEDLGRALGNQNNELWKMVNGYALPSKSGLEQICERLSSISEEEKDQLRSLLKVGIQWDSQVTLNQSNHHVSQVYCSAMPVAYTGQPNALWKPIAQLVLEAAYEATLCAAVINDHLNYQNSVYLTLLGGGAFGNQSDWIMSAIQRAVDLHKDSGLDIKIVSYGKSNPALQSLRLAE